MPDGASRTGRSRDRNEYGDENPTTRTDRYGLDVYDCSVDIPNVPIFDHLYSCVVIGHPGDRNYMEWCYGHGQTSSDHYDPARCRLVSKDPCMDSCMLAELGDLSKKANYNPLTNNCGQARSDVTDKCRNQCGPPPPPPPTPPFPPPPWYPWWALLF